MTDNPIPTRAPSAQSSSMRLEGLPVSSVVLDSRRVAWQRTFTNSWRSTMDHEVYTSELDRRYGPVTVLYDPRGGV